MTVNHELSVKLHEIEWTDDCNGKKDYDGAIISVSTRYWPRGGGGLVFGHNGVQRLQDMADVFPEIKPSAKSSIVLETRGDYLNLAEKGFEGDTQAEVQAQVEEWVNAQFLKCAKAIMAIYGVPENALAQAILEGGM